MSTVRSFARRLAAGLFVAVGITAAAYGGDTPRRSATADAALFRIEEASRDALTSLVKVTFTSPASEAAVLRAFYDISRSRGTPYFIKLKEWNAAEGVHWYLVGFATSREVVATEYFG